MYNRLNVKENTLHSNQVRYDKHIKCVCISLDFKCEFATASFYQVTLIASTEMKSGLVCIIPVNCNINLM